MHNVCLLQGIDFDIKMSYRAAQTYQTVVLFVFYSVHCRLKNTFFLHSFFIHFAIYTLQFDIS